MFVIGVLPALLVIYIRTKVPESPSWAQARIARAESRPSTDILRYLGTFAFLVVLMFALSLPSATEARICIRRF
jgi:SHS family lactate transporter-like MFS transporter